MKAVSESIYARGKRGIKYVRVRIPAAVRAAYPAGKEHIVVSLRTADPREAKRRAHVELARIDAEFSRRRQKLDLKQASKSPKRIAKLNDEALNTVAKFWLRQALLHDESQRQIGLDDGAFEKLGETLAAQRTELGRVLAQGKSLAVLPALQAFLRLCGLDFQPSDEEEAKRATYTYSRAVVQALDHQLARQRGDIVDTEIVAPAVEHPLQVVAPERTPPDLARPSWDMVFETWRNYVVNRPEPTTIASRTAWNDIQRFATLQRIEFPDQVTPRLMTAFVEDMRGRLGVKTLNERLSKIRSVYKIAVGKHVLPTNPAADTLGIKESSVQTPVERRLPFDRNDLEIIFSSQVFTEHTRSRGQIGEATYWIPVLMFYTGGRPEEIAGLALCDLIEDARSGWYFNIKNRPCMEDHGLFDDDVPMSHRRTLKNIASNRRIPVAKELIDLGLFQYVAWLRARGETVFFPTLRKDTHGKLSGAFGKFFGRYKTDLGFEGEAKVLYSFRHTMKDLLETARVPSKYLQRLLGHTTGDGAVTDGYGSDLPLERIAEYFSAIEFPSISALPWEPSKGAVYYRNKHKTRKCRVKHSS